jgi:hypothetical protein
VRQRRVDHVGPGWVVAGIARDDLAGLVEQSLPFVAQTECCPVCNKGKYARGVRKRCAQVSDRRFYLNTPVTVSGGPRDDRRDRGENMHDSSGGAYGTVHTSGPLNTFASNPTRFGLEFPDPRCWPNEAGSLRTGCRGTGVHGQDTCGDNPARPN